MQLVYKEICRGEGKTYIHVQVKPHCRDNSFAARCINRQGRELPCSLLPLGSSEPRECWGYVLVVFTSKQAQKVVIEELDHGGAVVDTANKIIFPFVAKWRSRLNGVLKKEECAAIRNYDWRGLNRQSILTFNQFVGKESSFLLRGSVFVSCENREDVFVSVYNQNGERVECNSVILADAPASFEDGIDAHLREFRYSVELPYPQANYENHCFVAGNINDSDSVCFEALESYDLKNLSDEYAELSRDAFADPRYGFWMKTHGITAARAKLQQETTFDYNPLFSIIVPLFKTPINFFREMIESVLSQTYGRWELVLVNASPEDAGLASAVACYAEADSRIKVVTVSRNLGITENTNEGIKIAKGDFLSFFDHDDVVEPNILFEYVSALNRYDDIDLLYCDEDKLFPDGSYGTPTFKPDFSIDLLRDNNYICHMLTVRKSLHEQLIPADKALDGAQDHNLALQVAERGRRMFHVSSVLYHWRISETSTAANASSKPYATKAGILAVQRHLDRLGVNAKVECSHGRDFRYKTEYEIEGDPSLSLIVPTQGRAVLQDFMESLAGGSLCGFFDVVLVAREEDAAAVRRIADSFNCLNLDIFVATYSGGFNYSKAINVGVEKSSGETLLLLHDDVLMEESNCSKVLMAHCLRSDVGAVGPMICDADGVIQQAGLAYVDGEVVPLFAGLHCSSPGYVFRALSTQNLSATSGICMMTKRSSFELIGGFDERFRAYYGDVDYCFRLQEQGLLVVYTPETIVHHRGSMARDRKLDKFASAEYYREKGLLFDQWATRFAAGDPYFSRNLSHLPNEASLFKLGFERSIDL